MLVAVSKRSIIGIRRRIVTIASTKSGQRPLLDTELHCRTTRTERSGALTGAVIVRISKLLVRITELIIAAVGRNDLLTERPCGGNGQREYARYKQADCQPKLHQSKPHCFPHLSANSRLLNLP